jgi:hypothetical protein
MHNHTHRIWLEKMLETERKKSTYARGKCSKDKLFSETEALSVSVQPQAELLPLFRLGQPPLNERA